MSAQYKGVYSFVMIIKVFKVSTREMFTFKNRTELLMFVYNVVDELPTSMTIDNLIKMLPKHEYYRVK